jgi:hypothetical protein
MLDKKLTEITSRLDNAFKTADAVTEDELRSHLSRYLCILTSGYVEESIKIIIEHYASINSSPIITNYISVATKNITNLNSEKMEKLLNSFSSQWGKNFCNLLTDKEKDALDSVVANRNNIAHGRNVGVSYVRVRDWYKSIKNIIDDIRMILSV